MSAVRILHAADLHLDSPFEALPGALAAQRRSEQRALLRRLPELAAQYGAQIILLSVMIVFAAACLLPLALVVIASFSSEARRG